MKSLVATAVLASLLLSPATWAMEPTVKPGDNVYLGEINQVTVGNDEDKDHDAQGGQVLVTGPMDCDAGVCSKNDAYECANPDERYVVVFVMNPETGEWHLHRRGCYSTTDLPALITSDMVLHEIEEVGLPQLLVQTTPQSQTLVNLETVFSTSPSPVTRTLTLLGQSVEVEATPATYLWHFGDGQSASTNRPGSPYPAMDLTHRYAKAGVTVQASVDTTYTARFRVNGGSWQDVNGTVTIVGPPTSLEVLEGTPVLSGNR